MPTHETNPKDKWKYADLKDRHAARLPEFFKVTGEILRKQGKATKIQNKSPSVDHTIKIEQQNSNEKISNS